jgi:hypothetical protein
MAIIIIIIKLCITFIYIPIFNNDINNK